MYFTTCESNNMKSATLVVMVCFTWSAAQDIEIWEATNLRAVSHFEGIEEYYNTLRRSQKREEAPTEPVRIKKRASIKKKICKRILGSHFFRMLQIDWVDIDRPEIREELRIHHRTIFYGIFDEYEYEQRFVSGTGHGADYVNRYKVRRVRIVDDQVGDEYLFTCVARDRASRTIREYFISQPYNVNLVDWSYPFTGRFIFSFSEPDEVLMMEAMAEDAAIESSFVRKSKIATIAYKLSRADTLPSESPDLDPICSLSPAEKLRLCTSLYGISAFDKKVEFLPVIDSVLLDCKKRIISVKFSEQGRFKEWVIGCKALNKIKKEIILYVSHGGQANSIYVYRKARGRTLNVYNFCNNVSVVNTSASTGMFDVEEDENWVEITDETPAIPEIRFFAEDIEE